MVNIEETPYYLDSVLPPKLGRASSLPVNLGLNATQRSVIVENEERSLSRLKRLLSNFSEVQVVGEAVDGPSAVKTIEELQPDLVFMDIDLPGFSGLQVLRMLQHQPMVIFTTAFNQHALEAFRSLAVDYLMKPIDESAIGRALDKLRMLGPKPDALSVALTRLADRVAPNYLTRVSCKIGDRVLLVPVADVQYFQSDNKYTSVHTVDRELLIDTPLVELERRVDPADFIRIHRAILVNISWISEIRRAYDGKLRVVLKNSQSTELVASRMYAESLRKL